MDVVGIDMRLANECAALASYRKQRKYAAAVLPRDTDLAEVWADLDMCIICTLELIDLLLAERWDAMTKDQVSA